MLRDVLTTVNDQEGLSVPVGLPPVVDAHVHVFPSSIFSAVWKWFDEHAWRIRYRMSTSGVLDFLLSRGVSRIVALQYAHKPGIAPELNRYMARKCSEFPGRVAGLATVFPGEENAPDILEQAFEAGLSGVKLHAHVQCFDMVSEGMHQVYDCCQEHGRPLVIHAGREPKSPAYRCDPHQICSSDRVEQVVRNYPHLQLCVPHLGFDEMSAYRKLIEKYDNLWLDTTMVLADYFPIREQVDLNRYRPDRILYGSDFPNIPYAWDRELKRVQNAKMPRENLERFLCTNAAELFRLDMTFESQYRESFCLTPPG